MKPIRLIKATALAVALGAILSVASSPAILHQAEAMAVAKGRVIASSAMEWVGRVLMRSVEWDGVKGN